MCGIGRPCASARHIMSTLRTVVAATLTLPRFWWSLRRAPYGAVVDAYGRRVVEPSAAASGRYDEARRVGQLVNGVANKLPLKLECVPRTLTTWYLLRKRGIIADMPIGVRVTETGERRFHTWAEVDGIPVNDRRDVASRYLQFRSDLPDEQGWE